MTAPAIRRLILGLAAAGVGLVLAGCGSTDSVYTPPGCPTTTAPTRMQDARVTRSQALAYALRADGQVERGEAKLTRPTDLPPRERPRDVPPDRPLWVIVASGEIYEQELIPCSPGPPRGCPGHARNGPYRYSIAVHDAIDGVILGGRVGDEAAWPAFFDCLPELWAGG